MKHIAVGEFESNTSQFLTEDEVLAIDQNGRTIGYYMPATQQTSEFTQAVKEDAMDRLGKLVGKLTELTGLTEDELSRFFDVKQPIPEDLIEKLKHQSEVTARATGS